MKEYWLCWMPLRLNEFNARLAVTSGQSAHLPTSHTLPTHTYTHTQQEHPSELQANRFAFDVLITIHAPHRPQCLLALIAVSITLSLSLVLRLRCKWQLICNPFYLHLAAIKVNSCITCCLLLLLFVVGVLHKRENISSSMSFLPSPLLLLLPPTLPLLAYQIFSWQVAGA